MSKNEEHCQNNMELSMAATLLREQPPCCRIAFCVALLHSLAEEVESIELPENLKKHGYQRGETKMKTAINFLKFIDGIPKGPVEVEL